MQAALDGLVHAQKDDDLDGRPPSQAAEAEGPADGWQGPRHAPLRDDKGPGPHCVMRRGVVCCGEVVLMCRGGCVGVLWRGCVVCCGGVVLMCCGEVVFVCCGGVVLMCCGEVVLCVVERLCLCVVERLC